MKKLLFSIIFSLSILLVEAQQPLSAYQLATITSMKAFSGTANMVYISSTNEFYTLCTGCVVDETTIYAGTNGKKWKKIINTVSPTVTIVDNLTTSAAGQGALDARQGATLKSLIDNKADISTIPRIIVLGRTMKPNSDSSIDVNTDTIATVPKVQSDSITLANAIAAEASARVAADIVIGLPTQSTSPAPQANKTIFFRDSAGGYAIRYPSGYIRAFRTVNQMTANRSYFFPDSTGTFALADYTVPITRTVSINGISQSLSSNVSFTTPTSTSEEFTGATLTTATTKILAHTPLYPTAVSLFYDPDGRGYSIQSSTWFTVSGTTLSLNFTPPSNSSAKFIIKYSY